MNFVVFIAGFLLLLYSAISFRPESHSYSYLKVRCLRADKKVGFFNFVFLLAVDKGFLALLIHRASCRINSKVVGRVLTRIAEFLTGVEIYYNAKIGKNVEIWHGNGVVIGQSVVVGDGTLILQQVTLGGGFVRVGERCRLGAGAKILGNIELGNDVVVTANAVVNQSCESYVMVGGVPAKVIANLDSSTDVVFGTKENSG